MVGRIPPNLETDVYPRRAKLPAFSGVFASARPVHWATPTRRDPPHRTDIQPLTGGPKMMLRRSSHSGRRACSAWPWPPRCHPKPPTARPRRRPRKKEGRGPGGDLRKTYDLLRRLRADGRSGGRPEERLKDWTDRAIKLYRDAVKASEKGEEREARESAPPRTTWPAPSTTPETPRRSTSTTTCRRPPIATGPTARPSGPAATSGTPMTGSWTCRDAEGPRCEVLSRRVPRPLQRRPPRRCRRPGRAGRRAGPGRRGADPRPRAPRPGPRRSPRAEGRSAGKAEPKEKATARAQGKRDRPSRPRRSATAPRPATRFLPPID